MDLKVEIAERGWVPDFLVRFGMRSLLKGRLRKEGFRGNDLVPLMLDSPLALATDLANEQHYEVPAEFYNLVLGSRLKYSACLWDEGIEDLGAAEEAMLRMTCERAGIEDGMEILDLGCGWGSVTLWIAEKYRGCRVTAVSNSASQRRFIEEQARKRGLEGIDVVTADMNDFDTDRRFDRIVSVEMIEHMRNYEILFAKISSWLRPEGKLFVHIFCHRDTPYFFELDGDDDWMARYFFTGGMMPSFDLFDRFTSDMTVTRRWKVNGKHYAKTLRAWLELFDARADELLELFRKVYGPAETKRWFHRWRMFFMACEELFAYAGGEEWFVGHYLLEKSNRKRD
jgi:cyclopropane-fatty-acyl-phospholipid synthase